MGDTLSQQQQDAINGATADGVSPMPGITPASGTLASPGDPTSRLSEPDLLSQLVQLLGHRPRHSLLLSDLGALLPGPLRHGVKEKGGLRSWLQKYPELFCVSGQPGKESVTLMLGSNAAAKVTDNGAKSTAAAPGSTAPAGVEDAGSTGAAAGPADMQGGAVSSKGCASDLEQRRKEEEEENAAAVQLRGLPYRACIADIKRFLGDHIRFLKDESSVQLVLNRDGRPSGFARVQFTTPAAARAARDELHCRRMEASACTGGASEGATSGQCQQERYVEVFLFSERPNKLRYKKTSTGEGTIPPVEEDPEAEGITKEQVILECREHMNSPGKGQLLLSMLGVALSPGARQYLKRTDQGLKHFLSQYPQEFSVDGAKGRECVSYLPAMTKGEPGNSDLPAGFPEAQKKRKPESGTGGPASGSISELQKNKWEEPSFVPQSPKVNEMAMPGTPKGLATPSDWGTPRPMGWDLRDITRPSAHRHGTDRDPVFGSRGQVAGMPSFLSGGSPGATGGPSYQHWSAWAVPPPAFWPPPDLWGGTALPWAPPPGVAQSGTQPSGLTDASLLHPAWSCDGVPDNLMNSLLPPFTVPLPGNSASNPFGVPPVAATTPAVQESQPQVVSLSPSEWQTSQSRASGTGPLSPPPATKPPPQPAQPRQEASAAVAASGSVTQSASSAQVASQAAVRLRGLPYSANEQDVLAFFAKHDVVECIMDEPKAVWMLTKNSGKPSGQAVVRLQSVADVDVAIKTLHGMFIGNRYIEVFPHSEEDGVHPSSTASAPSPATTAPVEPATGASGLAPGGGSFEGLSDTGGSGTFQGASTAWWFPPGTPGAAAPAANPATTPVGLNLPAAPSTPLPPGNSTAMTKSTAGQPEGPSTPTQKARTPGVATREENLEPAWQALFDFLKKEPTIPPQGIGSAGDLNCVELGSVRVDAM